MKISVIFTGGTIGSTVKNGWADVDESTRYVLLKNYENNAEIEFDICSPYNILSENLSADELNALQKEIAKTLEKDCDGIIVTHGTDTLQYTSAAIEYSFNGCEKSIVFVSAAYPLENEKTNGFANFEAAVEFIKSRVGKGVFVSYKNDGDSKVNIHTASRILQHKEGDSNIYSIDGQPYATYAGSVVCSDAKNGNSGSMGVVEYVKNPRILSVESYPGNDYSYSLENVNAVILKPYHSGTLDTANKCFRDFCNRAREKNIPVFVTNFLAEVSYKSTSVYEELGIILLQYETYVSSYMKIWLGLSLGKKVASFAREAIANEIAK